MPLSDYITPDCIAPLASSDRAGALREVVCLALADRPDIDVDHIARTLEARERELSTRVTEDVALPHTVVPELTRSVVAVGFHPAGVRWESEGETVRLLVLLLGPSASAQEHVRMLALTARALRQEDVRRRIREATAIEDIHRVLATGVQRALPARDARRERINRCLLGRAMDVAEGIGASTVILYADDRIDLTFVHPATEGKRLLLASSHLWKHAAVRDHFAAAFEVPYTGLSSEHRLEFTLLLALSEGVIESRDRVVCVWGRSGGGRLDSISAVDIQESFGLLLSLRSELLAGDVNHYVLNRILSLASGLSREGREGKPVGTLFVVGQSDAVSLYCRQLVINPFKGYEEDQRNVLDPRLEETIKEFSVIDGAFIVRGDGVLMSAGTHLSAPAAGLDLPAGLGARHAAAAAITAATPAVAIAISESTGTVSLYARGRAVMVLPREGR